jgi:hypothetical protein
MVGASIRLALPEQPRPGPIRELQLRGGPRDFDQPNADCVRREADLIQRLAPPATGEAAGTAGRRREDGDLPDRAVARTWPAGA